MNDEIREIFDTKLYFDLEEEDYIKIKDYITNLQKEIQKKEAMYDSLAVDYRLAQEENERLKEKLNCKEYFSSTMPEGTEFVILTKNNYDRQQKDIQLELIDYKSRVEKAVEQAKEKIKRYESYINDLKKGNYPSPTIRQERQELIFRIREQEDLLNILQNGSESND